MFCHKCKCCNFSWLSGFFALAAIAHIIRLIFRFEVAFNGNIVPMNVSVGIVAVAGVLSLIFCKKSCASCGCSSAPR